MPFSLLDYQTIVQSMVSELVSLTPELTDFTEGSVTRAVLETSALEIQRQNLYTYQGVREGIETGTYKNFGFTRLPGTYASGAVTFTRITAGDEVSVPIGTRVRVPGTTGRIYITLSTGTMPVGVSSVVVPIRAQALGPIGNTASRTIVEILDAVPFEANVSNELAILNGLPQESDDARRTRFREYIAGLSRGTRVALTGAAKSVFLSDVDGNVIERVYAVLVREPYQDDPDSFVGHVIVYVDNGSGTASADLLNAVLLTLRGYVDANGVIIPGVVAAGIDLEVRGVTPVAVSVTAVLTIKLAFDQTRVLAEANMAVLAYLSGLQVFETAVHAELVAAIMYVDGISDVEIIDPPENVDVGFDHRIVPGLITLSVTA